MMGPHACGFAATHCPLPREGEHPRLGPAARILAKLTFT